MQYIYILHTTATHSDYLLLCDEKLRENWYIAFVKAQNVNTEVYIYCTCPIHK